MKGYWRRPEATAEAIRDGWLRTGDLGTLDEDGDLRIVDRLKELIIRGGYNVYPREVEEVLYQHPDIVEAAVIGVPDPTYGEEVAAAIVLRDGATLSTAGAADLGQGAAQRLQGAAPRAGAARPPQGTVRQDPEASHRPRPARQSEDVNGGLAHHGRSSPSRLRNRGLAGSGSDARATSRLPLRIRRHAPSAHCRPGHPLTICSRSHQCDCGARSACHRRSDATGRSRPATRQSRRCCADRWAHQRCARPVTMSSVAANGRNAGR